MSDLAESADRSFSERMLAAKPVELLAEIPKGRRETLRITRESNRGHETVHIRVWFCAEDGEMRPGKSGVSLRSDKLDQVITALHAARLTMTGRGAL